MSYQVTARKWRPMVFDDVIGQSHVTNTLRNAIASSRIAHAYVFSGTRGCGKTTTARIFTRAINCLHPAQQNPDNTCEICAEIIDGRSLDIIEIDGASNRGIDEIRNLRESVRYTPARSKYKVYIIDEVHMLTLPAFNALLKTLEEPPAHVVFILATTEVHKVPTTILSRCQRFDFRRITINEIIEQLTFIAAKEQVTVDGEALAIIARRADGSMRDAQSIFDQARSFCGNEITAAALLKAFNVVDLEEFFAVTELYRSHDTKGAIELIDRLMRNGHDLKEFVSGLIEHLRNMLIVRATGSAELVEVSDQFRRRYEAAAPAFAEADLLRLIRQATELEGGLRWVAQPRFRVEATLLQMVLMENAVQLQHLVQQIDALKKKLTDAPGNAAAALPSRAATPESSVRVTGAVNAGYLKSSAAVRYSDRTPPAASADPAHGAEAPPKQAASILTFAPAAPEPVSLNADVVHGRWTEFVGDILRKKIALGTALRDVRLLDSRNGIVRVSCPDDFHQATLKRHRDFLSEAFAEFFGSRVTIEPVMQSEAERTSPAARVQEPTGSTDHAGGPANGGAEHPLLSVLKREFDAEKMRE